MRELPTWLADRVTVEGDAFSMTDALLLELQCGL
jgi:hypothetical protein